MIYISDHIKQLPLLVPMQSDHINLKLYISSDNIWWFTLYTNNKMNSFNNNAVDAA